MCECKCCSSWANCCRYTCRLIAGLLCVPILLVISLLALIVGIVLFPLKCCCPSCGPCLEILQKGIFFLLRAPFVLVMWCVGKATDHDDEEEKQELPMHAEEYGSKAGAGDAETGT